MTAHDARGRYCVCGFYFEDGVKREHDHERRIQDALLSLLDAQCWSMLESAVERGSEGYREGSE